MGKHVYLLLMLLIVNSVDGQSQLPYSQQVQSYRDSIDLEFADTTRSILEKEDIPGFHGLQYFPLDEKYRVTAKFKTIKNGKVIALKTSGTRTPKYRPYGTLDFRIDKNKYRLTLYQSADDQRPELKKYLLLAFTDLTNGFESYGGGRYIEFTTDDVKDKMIVDFNYCFNPYCAYSHKFSCVIPPKENFMETRIEAGAKKFHD